MREPTDEAEYTEGMTGDSPAPTPPEEAPIPVAITHAIRVHDVAPRTIITGQCVGDGITPTLIVAGNGQRSRLLIRNVGDGDGLGNDAYLMSDPYGSQGTAYPLPVDATLELFARDSLYMLGATTVAYLAEHTDG